MAPPSTRPTAAEQNSDDLHSRCICKRPIRRAAARVCSKALRRPRGAKPKTNFRSPDLNAPVDSTQRVAGESLPPAESYPMLHLKPDSYQEIADVINNMRGFGESSSGGSGGGGGGGGGANGGGSAAELPSPAEENVVDVELKLSTFKSI